MPLLDAFSNSSGLSSNSITGLTTETGDTIKITNKLGVGVVPTKVTDLDGSFRQATSTDVSFTAFGAGTMVFIGGGIVTSVSDERKKVGLGLVTPSEGLTQIKMLTPRKFKFHPDSPEGKADDGTYLGFYAQEVQNIPGLEEVVDERPDGTLSMGYHELIAPLVASVQELDRVVTLLQVYTPTQQAFGTLTQDVQGIKEEFDRLLDQHVELRATCNKVSESLQYSIDSIEERFGFIQDTTCNQLVDLQNQIALTAYEAEQKLDKRAKSLVDALLPEIIQVHQKVSSTNCNWFQLLLRKWLGFND